MGIKTIIHTAVELRRELHQNPELTWSEYNTARILRERLDALNIKWRSCAEPGTVAVVNEGSDGAHIGFRADMDALPMEEQSGVPWASRVSGRMHACGHDGHMAVLMGLAGLLKKHESLLPGPVSFLFQPAEEGGHGAKRMIDEGALDGIDEIYGWHNWPVVDYGTAVCPDGTVMAANASFEIELTGKGGHASQPELCRDPVLAASAVTMALQQIVSRRLAPQRAGVVSITSIDAVSGDTTIPGKALLKGSIRIDRTDLREEMGRMIASIAEATAGSYGVEAQTTFLPRYGTVNNHPDTAKKFRNALAGEFGDQWCSKRTDVPIMGSEDFSYYLEKIPGAFALVGSMDGGRPLYPCHNAQYDFDDRLIEHMVRIFADLAGLDRSVYV